MMFQVLTGGGVHWVQSVDGQLPPGAVPGGNSEDGETLYIGRAQHEGTKTIGKVQPSTKCAAFHLEAKNLRILSTKY